MSAPALGPVSAVDRAVEAIAAGRPVVLLDDLAATPQVVLVAAAELADTSTVALVVRESGGLLCVALPGERLDALRIPPMTAGWSAERPAAAVSVDLAVGVSTGISARDRAATVRALADPATTAADLVLPGHVLPLRAHPDGLAARTRPAEAAVDLCLRAGLAPAGLVAAAPDLGPGVAGPARALARRLGVPALPISRLAALSLPRPAGVVPAPPAPPDRTAARVARAG
ncbi:hypothetical protein GCM10010472_57800 [Pseudonocardia halophobica]|uniref:3,4-dihydroxy-2-butanone-4-phosphate synthase n=1 Tax=Pseudonocardia halophobica TaxID=29401 RepID=A0A9W6NWU8_9PSEU|nr:3,4-dihydroxy-2-butanone-4-phosphate synthase [Pseudonocardia halophobica]GLL12745.1 hypothetical protein GCM10017577_38860 [Pseudonocardia halophobica]